MMYSNVTGIQESTGLQLQGSTVCHPLTIRVPDHQTFWAIAQGVILCKLPEQHELIASIASLDSKEAQVALADCCQMRKHCERCRVPR